MSRERQNRAARIFFLLAICVCIGISLFLAYSQSALGALYGFPLLLGGPIASFPDFKTRKYIFGALISFGAIGITERIALQYQRHAMELTLSAYIYLLMAVAVGVLICILMHEKNQDRRT